MHFPSHPSLAVSSPALLLKCHLELKGPGVASSVKDICTDMLKYLIHPFPLSLKGPESSLSTTTFQNTFLITICLREQAHLHIHIFGVLPSFVQTSKFLRVSPKSAAKESLLSVSAPKSQPQEKSACRSQRNQTEGKTQQERQHHLGHHAGEISLIKLQMN